MRRKKIFIVLAIVLLATLIFASTSNAAVSSVPGPGHNKVNFQKLYRGPYYGEYIAKLPYNDPVYVYYQVYNGQTWYNIWSQWASAWGTPPGWVQASSIRD